MVLLSELITAKALHTGLPVEELFDILGLSYLLVEEGFNLLEVPVVVLYASSR